MSYSSPVGALAVLAASAGTVRAQPATPPEKPAAARPADWLGYTRTFTSERFAAVSAIGRENVGQLHVLCPFDTGGQTSVPSGLIEVDGMLIGTTEYDTFALDPDTSGMVSPIWPTQKADANVVVLGVR